MILSGGTGALVNWRARAEVEARRKGHDLGPWQDGAAWGARAVVACLDCRRQVFLAASGAISGRAVQERCEYVETVLK